MSGQAWTQVSFRLLKYGELLGVSDRGLLLGVCCAVLRNINVNCQISPIYTFSFRHLSLTHGSVINEIHQFLFNHSLLSVTYRLSLTMISTPFIPSVNDSEIIFSATYVSLDQISELAISLLTYFCIHFTFLFLPCTRESEDESCI